MLRVKIKKIITETELSTLIKIFPFLFALHEFEEWNILSWHQKYQSNIPDVTDWHLRIIFILFTGIVFAIFYFANKLRNRNITAYIVVPVLFLLLYNGSVHFYWSIKYVTYSPGLIFGFFLSVPVILIMIYKIMSQKMISKLYAVLCGTICTALFIHVIILGDKLEQGIINAMLLGKMLLG